LSGVNEAGIGLMPRTVMPAKERVKKSASPLLSWPRRLLSWPGLTPFSSAGSPSSSAAGRINHARLAGVANETAH
jgi:hypothetical protein